LASFSGCLAYYDSRSATFTGGFLIDNFER
jgi:hypothetical protein